MSGFVCAARGGIPLVVLAAALGAGPQLDAPRPAAPGTPGAAAGRVAARLAAGPPPIRGLVACERPGGIHLARLGEQGATVLSPSGAWPRFSPDGRQVAFLRGRDIMLAAVDGGAPRRLATVAAPRALAFAPGGGSVLFTDGGAVRTVDLRSGATASLLEGVEALELDAAADGTIVFTTREWGRFAIRGFDPATRRGWRIAAGCSASLSPDGRLVTCNAGDHRALALVERERGRPAAAVVAPPGLRLDNQFWSNHPDWIVSVQQGSGAILAHQVSTGLAWKIVAGGCDRPDLFVLP